MARWVKQMQEKGEPVGMLTAVGLLLISAGLLIRQHDRRGLRLGLIGMLFYLITVNLVVLYFDQFTYILATVIEFGFFMSMLRYRKRYIILPQPGLLTHN